MPPKRKSLATKARNMAKKRAMEDAETRENRLNQQRLRQAYLRTRENTPERIQRLAEQRMRQSSLRAQRMRNKMKFLAMKTEEKRLKSWIQESMKTLPKKRRVVRQPKKIVHRPTKQLSVRNYITCCAQACTNTSESHLLIRLPLDSERRQQWLSRINREAWTTCKNSALCLIHFEADAWKENAIGEKVLKDDVLPTLNLHGEVIESWATLDNLRNSIDDGTNDEESVSSVYIKPEALEPHIEVHEGTSGLKEEPFEAVCLNSNNGKHNDDLNKDTNIQAEQLTTSKEKTVVLETIKIEPLNIINDLEQPISILSCPECSQNFEEKGDLELHCKDKHSDRESTLKNKQDNSSCKLFDSMKKLVQQKLNVCDPASQTVPPI